MRSILFQIAVFFFLIILQSLYLNQINFYDVLIPWIVFLFVSEKENSKKRVMFIVLFAGYIKDSMSGGTFGVYISTYLWFYLFLEFLDSFFNIKNYFLMYISSLAALLLEAFFLFMANFFFYGMNSLFAVVYIKFIKEICWAVFTVFFLIWFFFKIHQFYLRFFSRLGEKFVDFNGV